MSLYCVVINEGNKKILKHLRFNNEEYLGKYVKYVTEKKVSSLFRIDVNIKEERKLIGKIEDLYLESPSIEKNLKNLDGLSEIDIGSLKLPA